MNKVSGNIRKYRAERGLTQDALAERLHVTRQAVSNWENGKNQPDLDMLEAVAAALEVEVSALFGEGGPARRTYPRYQKKAVVWVVILGLATLFLLLDRLFLAPYLLALRARTYDLWPDLLNGLAVLPICRVAAGMLLPAAGSLFRDVRPKGKLRLVLRTVPFLLLLPMLLSWLGLAWPPLNRVTYFFLTDPTGFRRTLTFSVLPFLAGLGLYPAWSRKSNGGYDPF